MHQKCLFAAILLAISLNTNASVLTNPITKNSDVLLKTFEINHQNFNTFVNIENFKSLDIFNEAEIKTPTVQKAVDMSILWVFAFGLFFFVMRLSKVDV